MDPIVWSVIGVAGALLMRAGFAVHGAGMVRAKNASGMVARYLCDLCAAALGFWAVGLALLNAQADLPWFNAKLLFGFQEAHPERQNALSGLAAVLVATAIVPGILAERARFWPALWGSLGLAVVIVPLAQRWAWGDGFLARWEFVDAGGAATLHWPAAVAGLVGALFVGPRSGKFNRDGSSTAIPGHSVPLAGLGVLFLVAGWIAFVAGHYVGRFQTPARVDFTGGLGRTVCNLLLGTAAGGMASLVLSHLRYAKPDIHLISAGALGALVAVSSGGGTLGSWGAVIVGAGAGVLVPMALLALDLICRIDDPAGGIAIHGVGAAWGVFASPLLAGNVGVGMRAVHAGVHLLALLIIGALAAAVTAAVWVLLKAVTRVRTSEADEFDGLDLAEHDVGAYPDFQQTMIKSYHLREM